ncbi:MAG: L-seryl-tRNA(Sec) selenium transferase [Alphaproteobacteria bacterium]|nr:L-seryl-tRNA(Sec) selenium transferase [Alphaproteobacteria bacterium]
MPAGGGRVSPLPAVHAVLSAPDAAPLLDRFGRDDTVSAVREALDSLRQAGHTADVGQVVVSAAAILDYRHRPRVRPVFNLTGTVLHTNLGRAPLPMEAVEAATAAMTGAIPLEFDLGRAKRGDRDDLVENWLCRLTGAEAATVVNNNAGAVLLMLHALAAKAEVVVSRGELVEIGGAFRIPEVMSRAQARLREVGTTNRTHLRDFEAAIGPKTAALMKVHTSNYAVIGFTAQPAEAELAKLAHDHGLPFLVDLGAGSLIDLERYGLPHEPTPRETLAQGADLVSFSGDKLLGGPQAGIIVGRKGLIARIKKNPLKRALRMDKIRLAALEAVLKLYADPDRLAERLPTLRLLTRKADDIKALGERLLPAVQAAMDGKARVTLEACHSQIGSGALPVDLLPSWALVMRPVTPIRSEGRWLEQMAAEWREHPVPVIGRVADGALWLDLRCLEDETALLAQLA